MDRNGRGKPPPGESSSFDLSKMSEAEAAAEMAARMARFRDTHKNPDAPAPAAAPAHDPNAEPPSALPAAAAQATPPRELDPTVVARMRRALDLNAQTRAPKPERTRARSKRRASSYGTEFKSVLAEGPNMNAIGMRPENPVQRAMQRARAPEARGVEEVKGEEEVRGEEIGAAPDQNSAAAIGTISRNAGVAARQYLRPALHGGFQRARRYAGALALVARQAASDRFVIAGFVAIAAAIVVWLLVPIERHAPPEIAHTPEATPPPVVTAARTTTALSATASAETASAEKVRPPQPPPTLEARAPVKASSPVPPSRKPESQSRGPHLVARLKPVASKPATLIAKPKPNAQRSSASQNATN